MPLHGGRRDLQQRRRLVDRQAREVAQLDDPRLVGRDGGEGGERAEHTLQPTALVHEAYLRLTGLRELKLQNRRHFYGAAAKAMRRILIDHARHRKALKRGGSDVQHVPIDDALAARMTLDPGFDVERLDMALAALATVAPDKAKIVELRYFAGLSVEETAALLEIGPATVKRHWAFARAWLYRELSDPGTS
jgi:RNA polymerase sigma factor (TIGR02999 family)